ncbi:MAG: sulfur carrier protein ThiS adenylyltransferase ThiF [Eubacteriales bacterium]
MNNFEKSLIEYIGEDNLRKIQTVCVGIAGAGGLGSNCAFNLVRSGFKNFVIADFDVIEFSNLDRQFYFYNQTGKSKVEMLKLNLLSINPNSNIRIFNDKLDKDNIHTIFSECGIIVEAFDKVVYKRMIVEEYIASEKFLVSASGLAGWGNSDAIKINKVKDNFYIIGDLVSEVSENMPPISPRVNIAAAKQADVILDYVLKRNLKDE